MPGEEYDAAVARAVTAPRTGDAIPRPRPQPTGNHPVPSETSSPADLADAAADGPTDDTDDETAAFAVEEASAPEPRQKAPQEPQERAQEKPAPALAPALQRTAAAYDGFRRMGSTRNVGFGAAVAAGVVVAGVLAAVAVSLVAWALDHGPGTTAGDAARLGLQGWLLSYGAPLQVPWGRLSLAPLLLGGLVLLLSYRGGTQLARSLDLRRPGPLLETLASFTVTSAVLAVLLSTPATTAAVRPEPVALAVAVAVYAVLGAGGGLLVGSGLGHRLVARLPGPGPAILRGTSAALLTLLGLATLLVALSLVLHAGQFRALTDALSGGGAGGWVATLTALLWLPNAVVATVAYVGGAGFGLGDGSVVSLTTVRVDRLPAFPLFAAIPDGPGGSPLAWAAAVVPVLAALAAAVAMLRALDVDERRPRTLAAGVLGVALGTSLGTGLLAALASGSLGDGRLASVGPAPLRTGLVLGVVVGALTGLAVIVLARRSAPPAAALRSTPAHRREAPEPPAVPLDEEVVAAEVLADDPEPVVPAPTADAGSDASPEQDTRLAG